MTTVIEVPDHLCGSRLAFTRALRKDPLRVLRMEAADLAGQHAGPHRAASAGRH